MKCRKNDRDKRKPPAGRRSISDRTDAAFSQVREAWFALRGAERIEVKSLQVDRDASRHSGHRPGEAHGCNALKVVTSYACIEIS